MGLINPAAKLKRVSHHEYSYSTGEWNMRALPRAFPRLKSRCTGTAPPQRADQR